MNTMTTTDLATAMKAAAARDMAAVRAANPLIRAGTPRNTDDGADA